VIYDTRGGHVGQERDASGRGVSVALGWLAWVLPGLGVICLVLYIASITFGVDLRAMVALIGAGRGGEVLGYLVSLSWWGAAQVTQAGWQNWPLLLVGGTLAVLGWVLRNL
jgi:hypothetical protein